MSSRRAGTLFFSSTVFREMMMGMMFSMKFRFCTCEDTKARLRDAGRAAGRLLLDLGLCLADLADG